MHDISIRNKIIALVMIFASQTAWAETEAPEHDHVDRPTEIVGIFATRLVPPVLIVPYDSAFGWLNYSSQEATIEFNEDIIPKLSCRSPGLFRASGSELAAPRVASGAFVTLCRLEPGEYDYHVEIEGRALRHLGKLVVEGPS